MNISIWYWYCSRCDKWFNEIGSWDACPDCSYPPVATCRTALRENKYNVEQACNICKDRFSCWTNE